MRKIKGNTLCVIQIKNIEVNNIGESVNRWNDCLKFNGILGLQSGDSKYSNFNAKIEESTHVLICNYDEKIYSLADHNTRVKIKDKIYDILLIDNPDELNEQLELYLRYIGGQNG